MTGCLSAVSFADKKLWAFAETETSKYDNKYRLPRSNIGHMYFCSVFAMYSNLFIECTIGTCVYSLPYIGKIFKTCVSLKKFVTIAKQQKKLALAVLLHQNFLYKGALATTKYYKLS